jgi:hypothetical protein
VGCGLRERQDDGEVRQRRRLDGHGAPLQVDGEGRWIGCASLVENLVVEKNDCARPTDGDECAAQGGRVVVLGAGVVEPHPTREDGVAADEDIERRCCGPSPGQCIGKRTAAHLIHDGEEGCSSNEERSGDGRRAASSAPAYVRVSDSRPRRRERSVGRAADACFAGDHHARQNV